MVTMGNGLWFANVCAFASAEETQMRENQNVLEMICGNSACGSPGLIGGEKLIGHSWAHKILCHQVKLLVVHRGWEGNW